MSELRARFARYGEQVKRLMQRKGKKWKAINAVRHKQRLCMGSMLQFPASEQSRALRRIAPYVSGPDTMESFERSAGHKIYVQVNMQVKHSY